VGLEFDNEGFEGMVISRISAEVASQDLDISEGDLVLAVNNHSVSGWTMSRLLDTFDALKRQPSSSGGKDPITIRVRLGREANKSTTRKTSRRRRRRRRREEARDNVGVISFGRSNLRPAIPQRESSSSSSFGNQFLNRQDIMLRALKQWTHPKPFRDVIDTANEDNTDRVTRRVLYQSLLQWKSMVRHAREANAKAIAVQEAHNIWFAYTSASGSLALDDDRYLRVQTKMWAVRQWCNGVAILFFRHWKAVTWGLGMWQYQLESKARSLSMMITEDTPPHIADNRVPLLSTQVGFEVGTPLKEEDPGCSIFFNFFDSFL
jgi:hypothetical protein